MTGENKERQWL